MRVTFQIRRNESYVWEMQNIVLEDGEPGIETDTGVMKIGDGETSYRDLEGFIPKPAVLAAIEAAITTSVAQQQADPIPDDQTLLLSYENAKV